MKLFRIFLASDVVQLRRDRVMIWSAICFLALLIYGTHEGSIQAEEIRADQKLMSDLTDSRLESLFQELEKNPQQVDRTPYEMGGKTAKRYLHKSPPPLALLSVGQRDLFESTYAISLREGDYTFMSGHERLDNPLLTYLGSFDFAFVIVWLLPLLIIVFSYQLISGEDELGTLPLLLSQPISFRKLLFVKTSVRFFLISVYLITAVLLVLAVFGRGVFGEPMYIFFLLCWILLYALFWFLLSSFINLFRLPSTTNLSFLFAVFLLFVVILPTSWGLITDMKNPVPTRLDLVNKMREATREIDNDSASLLNAYYFDHPELMPEGNVRNMAQYVYKNALKNKMVAAAARPVVDQYYTQMDLQIDQSFRSIYVSPAIILYTGFDALAQSGAGDYLEFQKKSDRARLTWRDFFEKKIFKDDLLTDADIRALPDFSFTADPPKKTIVAGIWMGLLGINILLIGLIHLVGSFRKI